MGREAKQGRGVGRLTFAKAREIRERFAAGESVDILASEFRMSDQAIKDVLEGDRAFGRDRRHQAITIKRG